ncbi:MAG TPA: hypothetical protein PK264_23220 [Hyphomicrobiaceae bacterium]|nr:hypothetical protein [Hyphomicrobiaceae bacterium]
MSQIIAGLVAGAVIALTFSLTAKAVEAPQSLVAASPVSVIVTR